MAALASATLNGNRVTAARSYIPGWGLSFHEVDIDGEVTLTGAASLVIADLTIACTVLSGGPAAGRSFFRLVSGAGGWGKPLKSRSYANDAGVKLSLVLGDLASDTGETFDSTTIDPKATVGNAWVRPADIGARVLEELFPGAWYVGEDGKTRIGARASATLPGSVTQISQIDLARATVTIASNSIAGILPGLQAYGLTVVDVEHEISAAGGLRTTLWGSEGSGLSRRLSAYRAIFDQLDPDRKFAGVSEYRVVTLTGNRLNLQPVLASTGMPWLQRVSMRPGVPGALGLPALGSRVLVGFVNRDPSRPAVLGFEDGDSSGFVPSAQSLDGGTVAIGPTATGVVIGGSIGADALVLATAYGDLLSALNIFSKACALSVTDSVLAAAASALTTALKTILVLPLATTKTKAS